ncbi:MAG: carboxypeptidase regulatory-like domain-containing protein, partial [Planctomycetota bacterium]
DGQGRFAANDLHPGRVIVWASAPSLARAQQRVDLEPGVEKQIRLELGERAILTGHVRDGKGAPIAGAAVGIQRSGARTDAAGAYRFADLLPVASRLQIRAPGYATLRRDVELTANAETRQDLVLTALPRLSGRVLSTAGKGLRGWIVEARPDGATGQRFFQGTSAEQGAFTFGVNPDRTYRLRVREKGQWLAWNCEHLGSLAPGGKPVDIVVPDTQRATAYVRFIVVDAENQPQRVWFQLGDGKRLATPGNTMPGPKRDDTTGALLAGPVPPRAYRLTIHSVDNSFPRFRTAEFRLSPEQQLDLGRIRIPAHGRVDYSMRTRGRIDFADVLVQINSAEDPRSYTIHKVESGGRGRWPLLPGRYEVVVYGSKIVHRMRSIVVRPNESTPLELELRLGVRVHLEAKLPAGEESLDCVLRGDDGTVTFRWTIRRDDPFGLRLSPLLPPGPINVDAKDAKGRHYTQRFEVKAQDERQRVELDFRGNRR